MGFLSVVGRGHLVANVVYERRAPTCRIRRSDPTERHGLSKAMRPMKREGVVESPSPDDELGSRALRCRLYHRQTQPCQHHGKDGG